MLGEGVATRRGPSQTNETVFATQFRRFIRTLCKFLRKSTRKQLMHPEVEKSPRGKERMIFEEKARSTTDETKSWRLFDDIGRFSPSHPTILLLWGIICLRDRGRALRAVNLFLFASVLLPAAQTPFPSLSLNLSFALSPSVCCLLRKMCFLNHVND